LYKIGTVFQPVFFSRIPLVIHIVFDAELLREFKLSSRITSYLYAITQSVLRLPWSPAEALRFASTPRSSSGYLDKRKLAKQRAARKRRKQKKRATFARHSSLPLFDNRLTDSLNSDEGFASDDDCGASDDDGDGPHGDVWTKSEDSAVLSKQFRPSKSLAMTSRTVNPTRAGNQIAPTILLSPQQAVSQPLVHSKAYADLAQNPSKHSPSPSPSPSPSHEEEYAYRVAGCVCALLAGVVSGSMYVPGHFTPVQ
jgi:hypothetical protein